MLLRSVIGEADMVFSFRSVWRTHLGLGFRGSGFSVWRINLGGLASERLGECL